MLTARIPSLRAAFRDQVSTPCSINMNSYNSIRNTFCVSFLLFKPSFLYLMYDFHLIF